MYTAQGINIFSGQREIIGCLKASNSQDPDILRAVIAPADTQSKIISLFSWVITGFGALLCLTIIGAIIGIPMILASWLGRRMLRKQLGKIKATYALFCKENGVMLKAA